MINSCIKWPNCPSATAVRSAVTYEVRAESIRTAVMEHHRSKGFRNVDVNKCFTYVTAILFPSVRRGGPPPPPAPGARAAGRPPRARRRTDGNNSAVTYVTHLFTSTLRNPFDL
jgi:hypothetical protein